MRILDFLGELGEARRADTEAGIWFVIAGGMLGGGEAIEFTVESLAIQLGDLGHVTSLLGDVKLSEALVGKEVANVA